MRNAEAPSLGKPIKTADHDRQKQPSSGVKAPITRARSTEAFDGKCSYREVVLSDKRSTWLSCWAAMLMTDKVAVCLLPPQGPPLEVLQHEKFFEAFEALTGREFVYLIPASFLPHLTFPCCNTHRRIADCSENSRPLTFKKRNVTHSPDFLEELWAKKRLIGLFLISRKLLFCVLFAAKPDSTQTRIQQWHEWNSQFSSSRFAVAPGT